MTIELPNVQSNMQRCGTQANGDVSTTKTPGTSSPHNHFCSSRTTIAQSRFAEAVSKTQ